MSRGIPNRGGYQIPATIAPTASRCVLIYVPDDIMHIAAFWGAMKQLAIWQSWEKEPTKSGVLAANVWKQVIENARESFESGECGEMAECCPIRFNIVLGRLQMFTGGDWVDLEGTENLAHSPTYDGQNFSISYGDQTTNLDFDKIINQEILNTPPVDPTKSVEELACAIATGLTNYMMDKFQDALDLADAVGASVGAVDSIIALFPPAWGIYFLWDAVNDALYEWINATIAVSRAQDTVEWRDKLAQTIYCLMLQTDGEYTEEIHEFIPNAALSEYKASIAAYLEVIPYALARDRAARESYGDGSGCELFECLCASLEFNGLTVGYDPVTGTVLGSDIDDPMQSDGSYNPTEGVAITAGNVHTSIGMWSKAGIKYKIYSSHPVQVRNTDLYWNKIQDGIGGNGNDRINIGLWRKVGGVWSGGVIDFNEDTGSTSLGSSEFVTEIAMIVAARRVENNPFEPATQAPIYEIWVGDYEARISGGLQVRQVGERWCE